MVSSELLFFPVFNAVWETRMLCGCNSCSTSCLTKNDYFQACGFFFFYSVVQAFVKCPWSRSSQCDDGAADKAAPGLGQKPIRKLLCVTTEIHLSQISSCLLVKKMTGVKWAGHFFPVVFLYLYILRVSLMCDVFRHNALFLSLEEHIFRVYPSIVFVCVLLADYAKHGLHHVPQDKKTKIEREGKEPTSKKSERKALHVQTCWAEKGFGGALWYGGCSDLLLHQHTLKIHSRTDAYINAHAALE